MNLSKDYFMVRYGSLDHAKKVAVEGGHYHLRDAALGRIAEEQGGASDEFNALHHKHLMKTMTKGSVSEMYQALGHPLLKKEHVERMLNRDVGTYQGRELMDIGERILRAMEKTG